MDITVLDKDLEQVSIVEIYNSLIWTDRYCAYGDFEIQTFPMSEIVQYLQKDYYLENKNSEHVMIIEDILINTDSEDGNTITITGRSLESLLDRRIVWAQTILEGNVQTCIKKLLNENAISPSNPKRKIPNLIFEDSTDPAITGVAISAQFTGDNLYDAIKQLCESAEIGFKITLNEEKQLVFKLYAGLDRSYSQETNPYVVFSPQFENIVNSNYLDISSSYKNVALVAGEGEGSMRKTTSVGDVSGLDRRELFVDARDISSKTEDNVNLTYAQYMNQLYQRGKEKLAEYSVTQSFEGQVEMTKMFLYGKDFFIGDIIQIANEYGMETKARISEIVMSHDSSGESTYPTLVSVPEEI